MTQAKAYKSPYELLFKEILDAADLLENIQLKQIKEINQRKIKSF